MEFLIFLIPFLIFLYMLYKHSKEDHILLRRGIKTEEIFDTAFISILLGWLISKVAPGENNYLVSFYIISTAVVIYFFGKRKKIPLGRIFDIFSIAFLTAVPLWFLLTGLFAQYDKIFGFAIIAFILLIADIIFLKFFYPKILNRSMPDGRLSTFLILTFSIIYIAYRGVAGIFYKTTLVNFETVSLIIFVFFGIFLLIKNRK